MNRPQHNPLSLLIAIIALFIAATSSVLGQTSETTNFENVKIKNFGQMDERFFRGGQPKTEDYKQLAALGIKTVIDLTDDPKVYEKPSVEALGMRYVNIPMSDKNYPENSKIEEFLKLVGNPETGKFYVHCAGGRHRTGVMGAVYRFNNYRWNFDRVYSEMKQYDFYTRWGHGDMKKFVEDYAVSFEPTSSVATKHHGTKEK